MPTATFKEATEKLGICPDDVVQYHERGNKGFIEFELHNTEEKKQKIKNDPIFELGKNPVSSGISDGSLNHDKYLYRHNP